MSLTESQIDDLVRRLTMISEDTLGLWQSIDRGQGMTVPAFKHIVDDIAVKMMSLVAHIEQARRENRK
jgi:hypothetical protein